METTGSCASASAGQGDTGALVSSSPPATSPSMWNNATIVGYAEAANHGEEQLGKLAETKATDPAVKAYARQMVADHRAMMAETKALAAKLHTVGDTIPNDVHDLVMGARDKAKELAAKPAGADWDKNYIDTMIDDHKKDLD